jgi:hypothetical protein
LEVKKSHHRETESTEKRTDLELVMNAANVNVNVELERESEGWRRLPWSRTSLLRSGLVALPRRGEESLPEEPRHTHPPPVDERPCLTELIRISLM